MLSARHLLTSSAALSGRHWVALARAGAWVVGTRAALAVLPWRVVSSKFEAQEVAPGPPNVEQARATLWAVRAVAKRLLRSRPCLTQALVARHLLRKSGVETALRIGAARDAGGPLRAHAWLERDGQVVIGGANSASVYTSFRPAVSVGDPAVVPGDE